MRVFGYTGHEGRRWVVALSAAALLLALPVGAAWGQDYTGFGPGSGEATHLDIISLIYASEGGTFVEDGLDFNNGLGVTVSRVFDTNGGMTLDILLGDETGVDQVWTDGSAMVSAQAKFASLTQSFGWNDNGGNGDIPYTYTQLLTEANIGGPAVDVEITGDFLWGIQPNGDTWWSRIDQNSDDTDHLMTYFVEGLSDLAMGEKAWLLFWEDLDYSAPSDGDYNDFVIELRAIPEPGTLFLVGAGLAGLAAFRQRRPRA